MIGSFWNLCRACPSMPVDKLHSEYRSTYRWHEYTGGSRPEVIKKPPSTKQFGTINEPPLPRRKKCPELAYRTHEFLTCESKNDLNASTFSNRARSEERGTPSRRSKSEGPYRIPNGQAYPIGDEVDKASRAPDTGRKAGESSGLFRKTISKLSTEYRIQFIWPHTRKDRKRNDDEVDLPKKSLSMGAIKAAQTNAMPMVHKKRTIHEKATTQELEPLCNDEKVEKNSELITKKAVRPFSQYAYEIKCKNAFTEKENFGFAGDDANKIDNKTLTNGGEKIGQTWYRDVVELRKKAEEYRNRGWGTEMKPDLYKKQNDLWEQVSRRSSLSALSLASTVHKPITKAEKDAANNKKSSPIKATKNVSQINFIDNKLIHEGAVPGRVLPIRHHLGRTTGLDIEDGALLPSPTRDKLMPTIPKSKEDESYSSQRGSPKKSAVSRHGSPQKGSPQKQSAQKKTIKQNRSQSVGPVSSNVESSPKRQVRSGSAAPAASTTAAKTATKKTPANTPTIVERRPRPTTLSTSNHYRSKSSSLPPTGRVHLTPGNHQIQNLTSNDTQKLSPSSNTLPNVPSPNQRKSITKTTKHQRPQSAIVMGTFDPMTASTIIFNDSQNVTGQQKKTSRNEDDTEKDGVTSLSSASPIPAHEIYEQIVKSPPEPTRVKSPEQILMRSPDPVNWVVPLDTGKTFTVTQNIRNGGDPVVRPQSEFKVSTPVDKPPSALSAPPNVVEQAKMEAWKDTLPIKEPPHPTVITSVPYDKPVPGSTLRCLDDPSFNRDINSPSSCVAATDDMNEARDRFDRFWGGKKDEDEKY